MSWHEIQGHDAIFERFRSAYLRGRLSGSFLFIGVSGIGKKRFALALAKGLLCKKKNSRELDPCGVCESCLQFKSNNPQPKPTDIISTHPDLFYISKPVDKSFIPLEFLIGSKERRGEEGLCFDISRTPYLGNFKVAIIDDADYLNAEGANAILKTLEEPPTDSLLILIGTSTAKQLPTIRSRCRIIRFSPLPPRTLASILMQNEIVESFEQGLNLAKRSGGSYDQAKELYDDAIDKIRTELNKYMSSRYIDSVNLAAQLNNFIEEAGKEAPIRRRRFKLILNICIDHFRENLKQADSYESMQIISERLNRTLDAIEQIDMNANLPFIVESWSNKLN
ncbi:MAG: DNA polymerase III subunit delta' [Planctomycetaceae bacterium]|jgi:DNA polymerase-3 subunit delta'|nr:DNA polymerase III subunit delta' [Planctomycetaceae bacterium]